MSQVPAAVSYQKTQEPSPPAPAVLAHAVPSGWLPVLVRTEDYLAVATLIATREAQRQDGQAGARPAARRSAADDEIGVAPPAEYDPEAHLVTWSVEQLKQLAESSFTTAQRWTQAIDVVAEHEGRLLSSEQVAALADMPIAAWRDAPRKIARHLQAHYKVPGWPLYGVGGRKLGLDDQVYWGISGEQAARWRQVRKGSDGVDA